LPHGGRLIIAAETEFVAKNQPLHPAGLRLGDFVKLTVTDTGTGMNAATLARAREPFFTTKKIGAGTGLGLPMALDFAEQSGGAMTIDSQPGKGTTVTLWLPWADAKPGAPARPRLRAASNRTPTRVLLVDDEDVLREVLADRLTDAGYTVLVASNGIEALSRLGKDEVVDLLLTDLSMPGMDGLTLIRETQERYPYMPALLLTGYAGDAAQLLLDGSFTGPVGLLRKPVSDAQLLDRIEAMLARRMVGAGHQD
jgi:CheY-like chemotaxis protein